MSDRWSGRGGYAQGQGLKFESHQPGSTRFYAKKSATTNGAHEANTCHSTYICFSCWKAPAAPFKKANMFEEKMGKWENT